MREFNAIKFFVAVCFTALAHTSKGQINYADIYNPHFNTHQARYFPGLLGTSFKDGAVDFVNCYAWAGNNSVGYKYIADMAFGDELSDTQIREMLSKMKDRTKIFIGADLQVINAAFKVRDKGKKRELFSMQIGHRDRVMANIDANKTMFDLLLNGNKQFTGKTVSLGPFRANAIYFREWHVGVAVPVKLSANGHSLRLRPAATVKVMQGIANVYTVRGKADMFTEPEGRYLQFNYDYLANTAYNTDNIGKMISAGQGIGAGADIGVDITIDNFLRLDVGLIDIGVVKFTRDVKNYSKKEIYTFEGAELDLFPEGEGTVGFNINDDIINPDKTENKYTTPLGMKFALRAEYRTGQAKLGGKDSALVYFQHRVFLTYIQGTTTIYNTTTAPNFSLGYMYSLKNILNVGLSINFLGYNKFGLGPFLSVKGGPFVIGFGSNNLMAFMAPKFGTGADAYFNLGFSF